MYLPKISIITVSYNSEETIKDTIESVINQDYKNLEYLVVDGASTDGTLNIINSYKDKIDIIVSEEDRGISDAFNKGIQRSTGEIIGIINSDDVLLPNVLSQVASCYDDRTDVYRGNILIWNSEKNFRFKEKPSMEFPTIPFFIHVCHQGTFITSAAYHKYGLFDLNFRHMMDLELLTRYYKQGARFKYVDVDVALFRIGGVTSNNLSKKKSEMKAMIRKNGGSKIQSEIYYLNMKIQDLLKKTLNLFGDDLKRKIRYKLIHSK
jgi:glycosyltransferase involved in cell wall biosynthesis